jgi:hypothetical protein
MILDHTVGSATATLAANDAPEPTMSRAQGSRPPLRPCRASLSRVMDAPTIIPSTESGNRAARHSGSPWRRASSYIWEYDTTAAIIASNSTVAMVTHRDQREDSIPITLSW